MGRVLLLTLPLPPAACSPNSRADRHERARAVRAYRTEAGFRARAASCGGAPFAACALEIVYVLCGKAPDGQYAPRDCDNGLAALKSALDGLTDAGVWASDSRRVVRRVCCQIDRHAPHRRGVACEGSAVVITVQEVA